MTLQTLQYITVIARYKSFSQAARSLYMSQSALSTAVKDLEDELGIRIFLRTNRGAELTPEGEDFLTYAKDILDRSNLLALRYKGSPDRKTSFSVSSQHLPFAVRAFEKLLSRDPCGSFDLAVRETSTNHVLYDVSTGKSDLGVLAVPDSHLPLLEKAFQTYHLHFTETARLCAYVFLQKQHPLAGKKQISVAELEEYPFVTYEQEDSPKYYTEEALILKPFQKTIHVTDRATKMLLIRNTDAFSIGVDLTNYNADLYFSDQNTEMTAVPLNEPDTEVVTGYIQMGGRMNPAICDAYISLLREELLQLKPPGMSE